MVLRLLFGVYMVSGNFILLNLFISVINDGLAYVNDHPELAEFDEELATFIGVSLIYSP
jgi:hypothetical protein